MSKVLLFYLFPSGGDLFPISLGYIAARLKSKGIDVLLEDLTINKRRSIRSIEEIIKEFKPDIVGFSAYQKNMREIIALSELTKNINPKIITIIGGPQAMFMPKEALLEMSSIDVLCRGEGELILPDFCECIDNESHLRHVRGIVFKDNGVVLENEPQILTRDLDEFESPFRENIFDFSNHKIACMLSSRGCPFACLFCYTPNASMRAVRLHSPKRVLEDIKICIDNNISNFWFADPSFAFNKQWAIEIMNAIIDKKWDITMWFETNTALVDRELLTKMAKAGVKKIAYGLEATDKKVLKIVNKNVNLERLKEIVKITQDLGIEVELLHIYGLPGQTYESARRTMEFIKSLNVKIIGNSSGQQLQLYFGTPLCEGPQRFGIYPKDKRRPSFLSPGDEFETKYMSKRLINKVKKVYSLELYLEQIAILKKNQQDSSKKIEDVIAGTYPLEISPLIAEVLF